MKKRSELWILLIWVGLPETLDHQGAREVGSACWVEEASSRRLHSRGPPRAHRLDLCRNLQTFAVFPSTPDAALGVVTRQRNKGVSPGTQWTTAQSTEWGKGGRFTPLRVS